MTLEDLGNYLQAEGLGTLGTTLFLGGLPVDAPNVSTQDAITALVETPGFPPEYVHDVGHPSRERPVVQILTRGAPYDYAAARTWAQGIWVALGRIRNQTLSGTFYLGVQPVQSVFKLRDDDYARPIMTCQFRCDKSVGVEEDTVHKYVHVFATPTTVIVIPGATHGLGTAALSITIWDNGTPQHPITGSVTVHPTTYEVTITFLEPLSGSVVLLG